MVAFPRALTYLRASEAFPHRGVAQPGSAPEWGSGGREFESRRPDWLRDGPVDSYGRAVFFAVRHRDRNSDRTLADTGPSSRSE